MRDVAICLDHRTYLGILGNGRLRLGFVIRYRVQPRRRYAVVPLYR